MSRSLSAVVWLSKVVESFAASQPIPFVFGVVLGLIADISNVLAFLLPLKVILLVGSDGVPRFLQAFVGADQKAFAVVSLSFAAAVSYGLSLYLGNFVKRLSSRSGAQISAISNELLIVSNQSEEIGNIMLQFMQLLSNLLFVVLVLALMTWMNLMLLLFLSAAILSSVVFIAVTEPPVGSEARLPGEINSTLRILASIAFFGGFCVILMPFLLATSTGNVVTAIVSFILLRYVLSKLPQMVHQALKLTSNRMLISALIFRHQQLPREKRKVRQSFQEIFDRSSHIAELRNELRDVIPAGAELNLLWVDPTSRNFHTFEVRARAAGALEESLYLERVVLSGREIFADNEQLLFDHVPREALYAPALVARYKNGAFDCLINKIAEASCSLAPYPDDKGKILEHYWSIEPPVQLKEAFCTSHPLLHARLTDELVDRIGVAINTEDELQTFRDFNGSLSRLQKFLSGVPLYIYNPELRQEQIYLRADGEILVPSWGLWSLEPVGTILPDSDEASLAEILSRVRTRRPSIPNNFGTQELRLVNCAARLEEQIRNNRFKKAFRTMKSIVATDHLFEPDPAEASRISNAKMGPTRPVNLALTNDRP